MEEYKQNINNNKNEEDKKSKRSFWFIPLILLLALLLLLGIIFALDSIFGSGKLGAGLLGRGVAEQQQEEGEDGAVVREAGLKEKGVSTSDEDRDIETKQEDGVTISYQGDEGTFGGDDAFEEDFYEDGYSVAHISFGNSVAVWDETIEGDVFEITSVKSENLDSLKDEFASALITWTTTKPSISELTYSKKDGSGAKKVRERDYGTSHGIFLDDLDFSTNYIYKVTSVDKRGNRIESDYYEFQAKSRGKSVMELIKEKFGDLF